MPMSTDRWFPNQGGLEYGNIPALWVSRVLKKYCECEDMERLHFEVIFSDEETKQFSYQL